MIAVDKNGAVMGSPDGKFMHDLARRLFPICRSLTGSGVRQTLSILGEWLPHLQVREVPSGTKAFDWTVPDEWNIRGGYLIGPTGEKIIDFDNSNIHVVGYSEPVNKAIPLAELQSHLHSIPEMPNAVPYITSYYNRSWGFCLTHNLRESLIDGEYRAVIDSSLVPGSLTYAELVIPGLSDQEVLISTYVCHPSMANNELSGPVVSTKLAMWLSEQKSLRYTYRFVFVPETIGSIVYISTNLDHLKKHVFAGFNVSCVGDDRAYSYLPSRLGNTLSDRVAKHVLKHIDPNYKIHSFLERGSDERQYCSVGVDLPVASVMRSKYGTFPEYHTSKDDLQLVTPSGLEGGLRALQACISAIEVERRYRCIQCCEPQMGKRGLYSALGTGSVSHAVQMRMDILCYCDGEHSLLDIAEIMGCSISDLYPFAKELEDHFLIEKID